MQNEEWLSQEVFTLTRRQAQLVMLLVELVDGAEMYIDTLHEKLGITGKEGYPPEDHAAIDEADRVFRLRHEKDRWTLHSEIQVALGGEPSFANNGLSVIGKAMT